MQDDPTRSNNDGNTVRGWKPLTIVLGAAAFILLATWAMNDRDRTSGMAQAPDSGSTVGLAPPQRPPNEK